jgi:pyrimidine operon attenuation protein/uracil phosphoribosyltransferase
MGQASPMIIYNSKQIAEGISSLAQGVIQRHPDPSSLGLIGIHSGGDLLVRRVEAALAQVGRQQGLNLDKGLIDISFYRDDWSRLSQTPVLKSTVVPFDVNGRELLLIDDVIFTGRTVRAALDSIFSLGRPARVELAVLVDRGHREYPIQPQYVGHLLKTQRHQSVNVLLFQNPDQDHATLEDHKYQTLKAS